MKPELRKLFDLEMAAAHRQFNAGALDSAFAHLERAHVLGQRYVIPHIQAHWLMLRIGVKRKSMSEVWGQCIRILLGALGSAIHVVPVGNTGGTNVSMLKRLPIAADMQKILSES